MKKIKVMNRIINLFFLFELSFALEVHPQNPFLENYEIIPPLGRVNSITASAHKIYASSDNYLLIFEKNSLSLEKCVYFDKTLSLIAYDQFFDELYLSIPNLLVRYNPNLGSFREYNVNIFYDSIGISEDFVYLGGIRLYSLNRFSGELKEIPQAPSGILWFKKTKEDDIRRYKFLNPYYFVDNLEESQFPFYKYPITALYDDGMYLYVGTEFYGILRYNKLSWQKERIIYGPLDEQVHHVRRLDGRYHFLCGKGISIYEEKEGWHYIRLGEGLNDVIFIDNQFLITIKNQLLSFSGGVTLPLIKFDHPIITVGFDSIFIYIGTGSGMYRIPKGTDVPLEFGPVRYPVYTILPTTSDIFVGGECGFYRYERKTEKWHTIFPRGVKDIVEFEKELFLLTTDNQLVRYRKELAESDTNCTLLPYFNIYDIDGDDEFIYCATFSGINYFDPKTEIYKLIYNLPRIKFNYLALTEEEIWAISDRAIYRLKKKYLD